MMEIQVQYCKGCDEFNLYLNGKKVETTHKRKQVNSGGHEAIAVLWEGIAIDKVEAQKTKPLVGPTIDDQGNLSF